MSGLKNLLSVAGLLLAGLLATSSALAQAADDVPIPPPPPPPDARPADDGLRPPLAQHVPQQLPPPVTSGAMGAPATSAPAAGVSQPTRAASYDTLSIFDAAGLEDGQLAASVAVGFPYALIRGGYGVTEALDLGAGFNSLYGLVNQPLVFGKYRIKGDKSSSFALALRTDLEIAFFKDPPGGGERSRWLTGQRDFSIHPGFILSTRSSKGLVFFTDVGVQVTFDTHPLTAGPLGGKAPSFTAGANAPLRMGIELPLSGHANFLAMWGLDLHFRREDSSAMPYIELGVTFGG